MGNEKLKRKDFLKNLIGLKQNQDADTLDAPPGGPDELFEKYSRKNLGERLYTERVEVPDPHQTELNRVGNVTSGLAPYTGPWTIWEANHLLRRVGFGVKKAEVDAAVASTMSAVVDSFLTLSPPSNPSPAPLNHYQVANVDSSGVLLGETWTTRNLTYATGSNDYTVDANREISLQCWLWGLCINENTTIREKMTQFWYHFIPVNIDDIRNQQVNAATSGNDYMSLLRTNALGNFKTLIKAIAKSPAMLVYLGNQYSTASAPNENFGRELLELFTMGKVPTQNYTEDDVKSAAKVLSGWKVTSFSAPYPLAGVFVPGNHNQSNKLFSAFFGNTTITNQTGANGANEFNIFFDMLFTQQATTIARYVCRRLYRYFVYYDIDTNVEANVIVPLAQVLLSNNWEMAPVVSTLFKSQHFYDAANKGVMIKSPLDFITGTLRTFNVNTTPPAGQYLNQYAIWNFFNTYADSNLEQGLGAVPNVSGWKAYYQEPSYYQNWINSNTIQKRATLLTSLINGFGYGGITIKIDAIAFVQQFPAATVQDPDLLINALTPFFFTIDLPATYKSDTKTATLLGGQVTNSYWTTAWNNYSGAPTNTSYLNIVKSRLNSLFTTFLQLAEYQLM